MYYEIIFSVFIELEASCQTAAVNVSPWFFDTFFTFAKVFGRNACVQNQAK